MSISYLNANLHPQDTEDTGTQVKKGARLEVAAGGTPARGGVAIISYPTGQQISDYVQVSTNGGPTVLTTQTAHRLEYLRAVAFASATEYSTWKKTKKPGDLLAGCPPRPIREGGGDPPLVLSN